MAIRAKVRHSGIRRPTAAGSRIKRPAVRSTRAERLNGSPRTNGRTNHSNHSSRPGHHSESKNGTDRGHGINNYAKALRFLATLADFERLRIVRYNSTNFDLDRMRL